MVKRRIKCISCGEIIGWYSVFSHGKDALDMGDPEYNENYGGDAAGEHYCAECFGGAVKKGKTAEKMGRQGGIAVTLPWQGAFRGWGPITRHIDGEGDGSFAGR
jgi:hypothetical protein